MGWEGKKIAEETFHYDGGKKACQVEKAKHKIDSFFNGWEERSFCNISEVTTYLLQSMSACMLDENHICGF